MYGVRIHCSRKAIAAGNNQKREESWKNESLLYLRDGGGDVQEKIDFLTLLSLTQRSLRRAASRRAAVNSLLATRQTLRSQARFLRL